MALYLKHFPGCGKPLIGGTSVAVDGLASGLSENGAQVTVLCEGAQRSALSTGAGYRIECFANSAAYRTFALAPELKRYVVERLAPGRGVCLVNGMFHPGAYAMARMLHAHAVPYVAVPHSPYDSAVFRRNAHLKWPYWYLFERNMLKRAKAVQLFDNNQAIGLKHLGVETEIIELPNGFDPARVPVESQLRWNAAGSPVSVMFFGRIDVYVKGLDHLFEAFARIAAHHELNLTIQGPGDRAGLAKQARRLAISDRVAFREPDYLHPPHEIVGNCDIFCLPSRLEGFGLAALEAMLSGRVLLVSERAGIATHVSKGDCGVVVPPTVNGIEAGLLALLGRQPEWREMGLRGRRYALANLQWKRIAAAALPRYERLVTRP